MTAAPSLSSGNAPSSSSIDDAAGGWQADLQLGFAARVDGATILASRAHRGPLVVQRPFYPEGPAVAHTYVLHPPGGLVGGDRLALSVAVDAGAHALLTTPAATKAYRSSGATSRQTQTFAVAAGATLEWLPQETILHDGAAVDQTTTVELAPGARFIGLDTVCFGLPARAETFAAGRFRQRIQVQRAGRPVFIERGRFDATDAVHAASWGLAGARVHGLLVACPGTAVGMVLSALRDRASALPDGDRGAITVLADADALVCRYLGPSAERARWFFHDAWAILRPALLGRAASAPRIWAT